MYTAPTPEKLAYIQKVLEACAEMPCKPEVHKPGQVCAPCEARKRIARMNLAKGNVREATVDIWTHDKR